jgi:hypothetical protein
MGADRSFPDDQLVATFTGLVGRSVVLSLEVGAEDADLWLRGLLVGALDRPHAKDEGNLTLLVGTHLVELRFGRVEHVQVLCLQNRCGPHCLVRLLLEGRSVLEVGPLA